MEAALTALAIRALLALELVVSLALLMQGMGLTWTPATAATLTFIRRFARAL